MNRLTVGDISRLLENLPQGYPVGSYNPMFGETMYLTGFRVVDGFIQVEFGENVVGHPFKKD